MLANAFCLYVLLNYCKHIIKSFLTETIINATISFKTPRLERLPVIYILCYYVLYIFLVVKCHNVFFLSFLKISNLIPIVSLIICI